MYKVLVEYGTPDYGILEYGWMILSNIPPLGYIVIIILAIVFGLMANIDVYGTMLGFVVYSAISGACLFVIVFLITAVAYSDGFPVDPTKENISRGYAISLDDSGVVRETCTLIKDLPDEVSCEPVQKPYVYSAEDFISTNGKHYTRHLYLKGSVDNLDDAYNIVWGSEK